MTLYEISVELDAQDHALTSGDGELDPGLEQWFERVMTARDQKLEGYCMLIQNIQARAVARETESRRLSDRATVDRNAVDRLKSRLLEFCIAHGVRKTSVGIFTLSVAANGGKVPLVIADPEKVTSEFTNLIPTIDRARIREYLERGESLPFAVLGVRGQHLKIL